MYLKIGNGLSFVCQYNNGKCDNCLTIIISFSALTLLVGHQEERALYKNWVTRCWRGYLSGVRCKWFAYGRADATATPSYLASLKSKLV